MVFGLGASSPIFIAAPILLFLGEGRLRRARAAPEPSSPPRVVEPDGLAPP